MNNLCASVRVKKEGGERRWLDIKLSDKFHHHDNWLDEPEPDSGCQKDAVDRKKHP